MLFPRQQRWLQHRHRHRQLQRQLWSVSLDDEIGKWILFWMPSNHWQYEEIMAVMCNVCRGTHTHCQGKEPKTEVGFLLVFDPTVSHSNRTLLLRREKRQDCTGFSFWECRLPLKRQVENKWTAEHAEGDRWWATNITQIHLSGRAH